MQTLAADIATTFVDDAIALAAGFVRAVLRPVTGPIERIANACDIAGVLAERRATFRMWRAKKDQARRAGRTASPRRLGLLGRCSPFRHLGHLT
jgi:hypothetical protein